MDASSSRSYLIHGMCWQRRIWHKDAGNCNQRWCQCMILFMHLVHARHDIKMALPPVNFICCVGPIHGRPRHSYRHMCSLRQQRWQQISGCQSGCSQQLQSKHLHAAVSYMSCCAPCLPVFLSRLFHATCTCNASLLFAKQKRACVCRLAICKRRATLLL